MLTALVSAKHAPGVTTTALGLACAWPRPVLLTEADPAGGDLPAWLGLSAGGGLVDAVLELRRNRADGAELLAGRALALDAAGRLRLLVGVDDPAQAAAVAPLWPLLADALVELSHRGDERLDVIADCGRLSDTDSPWPLLQAADIVALAVRPTVAGVRLAARWLAKLRDRIGENTRDGGRFRLLVIGDGPYPAAEIAEVLDVALLSALPDDRQAAGQLAAGGGRGLARRPLWRTLVKLADQLADHPAPPTDQPEHPDGETPAVEAEGAANADVSTIHAVVS